MDLINSQSSAIGGATTDGFQQSAELTSSFNDNSGIEKSSAVNKAESELKEMQKQIESYNLLLQQLASQQKMAVKKLADMDEQIRELNKTLEQERSEVEAKQKLINDRKAKLQHVDVPKTTNTEENFDPFANADPFAGEDPFKNVEANLALPDDDPFNPSSAPSTNNKQTFPVDDPFAPTKWS